MMKRINNVLLLSAFVALTTNLTACNNILKIPISTRITHRISSGMRLQTVQLTHL